MFCLYRRTSQQLRKDGKGLFFPHFNMVSFLRQGTAGKKIVPPFSAQGKAMFPHRIKMTGLNIYVGGSKNYPNRCVLRKKKKVQCKEYQAENVVSYFSHGREKQPGQSAVLCDRSVYPRWIHFLQSTFHE